MLPSTSSLGWRPSLPLASLPAGAGGAKSPGVGVRGAHCQLPALPSALHEDAGADPAHRDPALLPPSLQGPCPAPTMAQRGPPEPSQCSGGGHSPARHQRCHKAPQHRGFLASAAQRARPGGNAHVKGNGAAVPRVYTPARLPSPGLIFLLAPGEHHAFPNGPARWKTRRPRPPCLDAVPGRGRCANTAPRPAIVPVL